MRRIRLLQRAITMSSYLIPGTVFAQDVPANMTREQTLMYIICGAAALLFVVWLVLHIVRRREALRREAIIEQLPLRYFVIDRKGAILSYSGDAMEKILPKQRKVSLNDIYDKKIGELMQQTATKVFETGKTEFVSFEFEQTQRAARVTRLKRALFHRDTVLWVSKDADEFDDLINNNDALLNSLPFYSYVLDLNNERRFVYINSNFAHVLGFEVGDILGKKIDELSCADDPRIIEIRKSGMQASASDAVQEDEMAFRDYQGKEHLGHFYRRKVTLSRNRSLLFTFVFDVTDKQKAQQAAEESAEWFRRTLNAIGDGVMTTDAEGKIVLLNPVAERMTGCKQAHVQGVDHEKVFNIVSSLDDTPMASPVRRALRTGNVVELANHTELISQDGSRFHVADSAAPIFGSNNEILGSILVFRDVSEEYANRDRLRSALLGLEYASELSRSAFFRLRVKDRMILTQSQLLPKLWPVVDGRAVEAKDYILPEDLPAFNAASDTIYSGERSDNTWVYRARVDGEVRHYRMRAMFDKNALTEPALVGVIQDVTEWVRKENELADTIRLWDFVLNAIPVMIFAKTPDQDYRYTVSNAYFEKFMGHTHDEIIAHNDYELFADPTAAKHFRDWDEKVVEKGEVVEFNESPLDADGAFRHLRTTKIPFTMTDGTRMLLGVTVDLTRENEQRRQMDSVLKLFEFASDMGSVAAFTLDPKSKRISGSHNLSKIWPTRAGKALLYDEVVYPEDMHKFTAAYEAVLHGEKDQMDVSFRCSYFPTMRYYHLRGQMMDLDNRRELYGVVQDVTEITHAAAHLKETQELWEMVINAIRSSLFVKDPSRNFRYVTCNRAYAALFNLEPEQMNDHTDAELHINEMFSDSIATECSRALYSGKRVDCERTIVDHAGMTRRFRVALKPFVGVDGHELLIGSCDDISLLANMIQMEQVNSHVLTRAVMENDFRAVLGNIMSTLMENLHCDRVVITRCNDEGRLVHEGDLHSDKMAPIEPSTMAYHEKLWNLHLPIYKRDKMVMLPDLTASPDFQHIAPPGLNLPAISFSGSPIFVDGTLWGALFISYVSPYVFGDADTHLQKAMCNIIAMAEIRARQNEVLKRAEMENQTILDNINCPIALYAKDGTIVRVNRRALELFETQILSPEPYVCRRLTQCVIPHEKCPVNLAFRDGQTHYHYDTRQGATFLVEARPICDKECHVINVVKSAFDITELKELADIRAVTSMSIEQLFAMGDEHEAVEQLLENVCKYIGATRASVCYIDKAAHAVHGFAEYVSEEAETYRLFTGTKTIDFPADSPWAAYAFENESLFFYDLHDEENRTVLEKMPPKLQQRVWDLRVRSMFMHQICVDKAPWGCICIICEKKPMRVLSQREQEMLSTIVHMIELLVARYRSHLALENALDQARQDERAKAAFLATMSHEIRTPLNAVIGFAEMLKDGSLSPDSQKEYLEIISHAGNSLLALINNVLDISKLEAGQMAFSSETIIMDDFLNEVCSIFRQKADERHLKLDYVLPEKMPDIALDKLRVRQILFNLIGNAIKFTDSGSIMVNVAFTPVTKSTGTLFMTVADTGIGISPDDQVKIFEPFVQAGAIRGTIAAGNGTGLGLAICHRMAEKMQGHLSVESTLGKGSSFTLELDNVPFIENNRPPKSHEEKSEEQRQWHPSACEVMLVDDVPVNLKVMSVMMKKLGLTPLCACNADEALSQLQNKPVDYIFTDLWMPGMNGAEFARALRHDKSLKMIKIIAVTADTQSGDNFDMSVFDGVLTKPLSFENIHRVMSAAEEQKKNGEQEKP